MDHTRNELLDLSFLDREPVRPEVPAGEWICGHYFPPPIPAELAAERRYEAEERDAIAEFGGG